MFFFALLGSFVGFHNPLFQLHSLSVQSWYEVLCRYGVGLYIWLCDRAAMIPSLRNECRTSGCCLMKSMEMDSHGHGGIGSCLRKPYGLCRFALECAQTVQDQMYCLTALVSPGQ